MKKLFLLICILALLSSCVAPRPTSEQYRELVVAHNALQGEFSALQYNYENLRGVEEKYRTVSDSYNNLVLQHHALQTEYAILDAYYQALVEQYNSLLNSLTSSQLTSDEARRQYQILLGRRSAVSEYLEAVNSRQVGLLSDYLTESEYEAFYKGWDLLWGTLKE